MDRTRQQNFIVELLQKAPKELCQLNPVSHTPYKSPVSKTPSVKPPTYSILQHSHLSCICSITLRIPMLLVCKISFTLSIHSLPVFLASYSYTLLASIILSAWPYHQSCLNPSEAGAYFTHLPVGRGFSAIP